MTIIELTAAKDYLERGVALLKKCGCVQADDIQTEIDALTGTIVEMQMQHINKEAA